MQNLTPEQKARADARKLKFRQLVKQVGEMSAVQQAELSAKMGAIMTAEGRALSLHNTLLLCLQCPTATIVGGFRQWLKHGRAVRKGEHGHMIWFPRHAGKQAETDAPKSSEADAEAKESVRFMIGTVFDISQTMEVEGAQAEPLPARPMPAPALAVVKYEPTAQPQPEEPKHWTAKILEMELV